MSGDISGYKKPATSKGTIVVDLGCATYQLGNKQEDSIITLIRRFQPSVYFGFDPAVQDGVGRVLTTTLLTSKKAAWTHNGRQGFTIDGDCSHVGGDDLSVTCFDTAAFLKTLPNTETILKLDVEGAEYVLLPHLIEQEALRNVSRVLVEWHEGKLANGYETDRKPILDAIPCEVEEWH